MSDTFVQIKSLIEDAEVLISEHGYDELANDGLFAREIVEGVGIAILVEDYPDFHKGPSILLLQQSSDGEPVHTVWGIPKGKSSPAVLITAYRPDPERWTSDFLHRKE